jgi:anthranilate/para-aminobenzoate synthase component I
MYNPTVPIECDIRLDSSLPQDATSWTRTPGRAELMLRCDAPYHVAQLLDASGTVRAWSDPIDALRWLSTEGRLHDWIGWISYDLGRWFERVPTIARNDLDLPLFVFTSHRQSAVHGGREPQQKIILGETRELRSTFSKREYERAVARVIDYIRAGDIFQVNLSQRFSAGLNARPQAVYQRLRSDSPAAFGACLVYDDHALICNSPELFLRVTPDRRVVTRPIKGTRPRAPGMEIELLNSPKDQAELNMIVDLERNDLGRVCEIGSVRVTEPRVIEAHPTVYHGVSSIEGRLRDDVTFLDLLRATFPGGSVTGAPKIRAMEIIEELEPVRRGPYCGAIGHLDRDGTIELNVAIRTMIVKDGLVHIPVGGGIVADSEPAAEYEETLVKARANFAAVGIGGDQNPPHVG